MGPTSSTTIRLAALLALAIPVGLLGLLIIDNLATGDSRIVGHVELEALLVLAIATLWRWPRKVGLALVVGSAIAIVVNPLRHLPSPWEPLVFVDVVVFVPPLLAGLFLLRARRVS